MIALGWCDAGECAVLCFPPCMRCAALRAVALRALRLRVIGCASSRSSTT